jgi:V/A-type H+-transporting ATPase subunit I
MRKLTVLTPAEDADALVRKLMRLRCVEIRTTPLGGDASAHSESGGGTSADGGTDGVGASATATSSATVVEDEAQAYLRRNDCDTAMVAAEGRVKDVSEAIPILDSHADKSKPMRRPAAGSEGREKADSNYPLTGSYEGAWAVVREALRLQREMDEARAEDTRLRNQLASLEPWMEYDAPLDEESTDTCRIWLGSLPAGTLLSTVDDALRPAHAGVGEVFHDKSGLYVSLIFLKEDEDVVNRALNPLGFLRISFAASGVCGTAREARQQIVRRRGVLENQITDRAVRLRALSAMVPDVERLYDVEMTTLLAVREEQKLAATTACCLLEGWVPAQREAQVAAALNRLDCAYDMQDPPAGEEPPVLLKNNGYASNFEWVVGMYSYPKYGTYDPTFIMSIFYFVIFGLMFADVGYGALLVLVGFLGPRLLHMKEGMKRSLNMFGYCGIACMILGFVFGGWFGDMPYALMVNMAGLYDSVDAAKEAVPLFNGLVVTLGGTSVSLNPLEEPMVFLVISLIMGAIHLVAGMAVKFVLLCREGKVFDAIFDIGSWWVLFVGIGMIFLVPTAGYILLGVGALMIVATAGRSQKNLVLRFLMGLKGLYDIVSYASDLLSYCRILALGLAAGVIAQVVNLIATMGGPSVGGFLVMVLVLLFGHLLNMAINLLGAFVHTSRLQYLEFFNKFFVDGGEPFQPAMPSEKYTVEKPSGEDSDSAAIPS